MDKAEYIFNKLAQTPEDIDSLNQDLKNADLLNPSLNYSLTSGKVKAADLEIKKNWESVKKGPPPPEIFRRMGRLNYLLDMDHLSNPIPGQVDPNKTREA